MLSYNLGNMILNSWMTFEKCGILTTDVGNVAISLGKLAWHISCSFQYLHKRVLPQGWTASLRWSYDVISKWSSYTLGTTFPRCSWNCCHVV